MPKMDLKKEDRLDMQNISLAVQGWIERPIDEKEKSSLPESAFRHLTQPIDSNYKNNRFSLVRRIIEHVAGMTDRYISNEYNRINQSGRETELQDETYFFY
jgi:dGTP triphosphohydrolase